MPLGIDVTGLLAGQLRDLARAIRRLAGEARDEEARLGRAERPEWESLAANRFRAKLRVARRETGRGADLLDAAALQLERQSRAVDDPSGHPGPDTPR